MNSYLITGITGTLGTVVAKKLLAEGHHVTGLSRDENKQQAFMKHPNLDLFIGDIRDPQSLDKIKLDIDVIFHFAALKHVDVCGKFPMEAVKTNILGTANVCEFQNKREIPKLILTSTDKAFKPINQYGKTKAIAENIVAENPNNAICRYGNVFGSRGSVAYKFIESLKSYKHVQMTDPMMTRFFMSIEEAADFVIDCQFKSGIQVPSMKSTDLVSLAAACGAYLGIRFDQFNTTIFGNRGKEKIHEEMNDEYNSFTADRFTQSELVKMYENTFGRI